MLIASSRRKLFEMRRSDYEEKLRRTRSVQDANKCGSLDECLHKKNTNVSGASLSTAADHSAETSSRRTAPVGATQQRSKQARQASTLSSSRASMEDSPSLDSIREEDPNMSSSPSKPSTPQHTSQANAMPSEEARTPVPTSHLDSASIPDDPRPKSPLMRQHSDEGSFDFDVISLSSLVVCRGSSSRGYNSQFD